jgi:hypothetical protein
MPTSVETKELRVDIPLDLMRALDGIALSEDMERNKYIVSELERIVKTALHKSSLLQSILRGNPLLPTHERKASE